MYYIYYRTLTRVFKLPLEGAEIGWEQRSEVDLVGEEGALFDCPDVTGRLRVGIVE